MSGVVPVFFVVVAEDRLQAAGDLVAEGQVAAARDLDLVGGIGELKRVRRAVADRLAERGDERSAWLIPVRVDRREWIVSPQVGLDAGRIVLPAVLRGANHDPARAGQRTIGACAV